MIDPKIIESIKTKETPDAYKSISFEVAIHRDQPIQKDHECKFIKIDAQNIQCKLCKKGYTGPQIDKLLQILST